MGERIYLASGSTRDKSPSRQEEEDERSHLNYKQEERWDCKHSILPLVTCFLQQDTQTVLSTGDQAFKYWSLQETVLSQSTTPGYLWSRGKEMVEGSHALSGLSRLLSFSVEKKKEKPFGRAEQWVLCGQVSASLPGHKTPMQVTEKHFRGQLDCVGFSFQSSHTCGKYTKRGWKTAQFLLTSLKTRFRILKIHVNAG